MNIAIPSSIAIAGIYGYIGNLIYQAAVDLGVKKIYGFDPGVKPNIFRDSDRLEVLENQESFYNLDVDIFHIATHPQLRQCVFHLIKKGKRINIEKPMAHPSQPEECFKLMNAVKNSSSSVYFNFVELFNPLTFEILSILDNFKQFDDFKITRIYSEICKNREDKTIYRNRKIIVPIQYQESCHCLAWIIFILNRGSFFENVFPKGIEVKAVSEIYDPPNPEDYTFGVVDGKIVAKLFVEDLLIEIYNDFKRKDLKSPSKLLLVEYTAKNQHFRLELKYNGVNEYLLLNGEQIEKNFEQNRHKNTIVKSWYYHQQPTISKIKPDVDLAWLVFGLSATLWKSCFENRTVEIRSEADLIDAVSCYPNNLARLPKY